MKFGMKNRLGLGFAAALLGLGMSSKASKASKEVNDVMGMLSGGVPGFYSGSPIFFGKSQKTKKSNRKRFSHNAKLKRRKAA